MGAGDPLAFRGDHQEFREEVPFEGSVKAEAPALAYSKLAASAIILDSGELKWFVDSDGSALVEKGEVNTASGGTVQT